jgi:hypothetical protein
VHLGMRSSRVDGPHHRREAATSTGPHPAPIIATFAAPAYDPPRASEKGEVEHDDGVGSSKPVPQGTVVAAEVAVEDPAVIVEQFLLACPPPIGDPPRRAPAAPMTSVGSRTTAVAPPTRRKRPGTDAYGSASARARLYTRPDWSDDRSTVTRQARTRLRRPGTASWPSVLLTCGPTVLRPPVADGSFRAFPRC